MKCLRHIGRFLGVVLTAALTFSCDLLEKDPVPRGWGNASQSSRPAEAHPSRTPAPSTRKVLLIYSAGYNTLRSYLREDIDDLRQGYVPGKRLKDDVLLVFSHLNKKAGDYSTPTQRVLFRLTRDEAGNVVADTLLRMEHGSAASAQCVNEVLSFIQTQFPAKSYGMVFSSHGSGWFPEGYYAKPEDKYFDNFSWETPPRRRMAATLWPTPLDGPPVKSIGQEQLGNVSSEMTLRDFAGAFPLHLDYLLIDACLMGGIETAYELKDICDGIGFSQAEVLADGFDYKAIARHLLEGETPDPVAVCSAYYDYYNRQSGSFRSATISFVNTAGVEALASVCRQLFEKYRAQISALDHTKIQNFGRKMSDGGDRGWYFDLKDILVKANASGEDLDALQEALDGCIIYKAATPKLLGTIDIKSFSGFTMYLPAFGTPFLDTYYKENISWNEATSLVQ